MRLKRISTMAVCALALVVTAARGHSQVAAGPITSVTRLHWIQGAWIGRGAEQPFFECYRIVGDSSVEVMTYGDSLFVKVEDTTRFVVRQGQLGNWDAKAKWAASEIG